MSPSSPTLNYWGGDAGGGERIHEGEEEIRGGTHEGGGSIDIRAEKRKSEGVGGGGKEEVLPTILKKFLLLHVVINTVYSI